MFFIWDVLRLESFWGLGCFEAGTFWSWNILRLAHFLAWNVLYLGHFEAWDVFCLGRFEAWDVLNWDFCLVRFCRSTVCPNLTNPTYGQALRLSSYSFGSPLNKIFQGPMVCCSPPSPNTLVYYFAVMVLKPISYPFLSSMLALRKYFLLECRHLHFLALKSYSVTWAVAGIATLSIAHLFQSTLARDFRLQFFFH
jgi:hypothetical protein